MNEIEQKRKELEEEIELCIKEEKHLSEHIEKSRLEGFNLGVELARKEFLDFLENDILEEGGEWKVTRYIRLLQQKIKQQLEGEKSK